MRLEMWCTVLLAAPMPATSAAAAVLSPNRSAPERATAVAARLPCDLYSAGGTPCVAAHSVSRALYAAYAGALFSVQRSSDNATKDIGVLHAGGVADMVALDAFCPQAERCTVQRILDQSPWGNHIVPGSVGAQNSHNPLQGVNATKQRVMLAGGHIVPVAVIENGRPMGYRNDTTSGVPKGDEAESIYMVASGRHYNDGCCFDVSHWSPLRRRSQLLWYCSLQCSHSSAVASTRRRDCPRLSMATPSLTSGMMERVQWRQCTSAMRPEDP